jgi:hypothetical protein
MPPELASRSRFMAAAVAGAALAMLGVYAGLGFHDGFGDWDLHRVGRRFFRYLPWIVCLSAFGGALLRGYYAALLTGKPTGLGVLWTIVRAFAHFPLYGGVALLSVMIGFAGLGLRALRHRFLGGEAPGTTDDAVAAWIGPPIWFIIMPFNLMGIKGETDSDVDLPETISTRRLLRWLPAVLAMLMLWTGAVSEDSGERVDPYWLAAFASYWLGDYLAVAWLVSPVMIARRRIRPAQP